MEKSCWQKFPLDKVARKRCSDDRNALGMDNAEKDRLSQIEKDKQKAINKAIEEALASAEAEYKKNKNWLYVGLGSSIAVIGVLSFFLFKNK